MNQKPNTARPSFHVDFFQRAEQFARDILTLVPELETVAIIPGWEQPQPELPVGFVQARDESPLTIQEIGHLSYNIQKCLSDLVDHGYKTLAQLDKLAQSLAADIQQKSQPQITPETE
jgi:hypothetical protein